MAKKKQGEDPKKKLPKEKHILIDEVTIGDNKKKKGDPVYLTKEGARYFRQIRKIK